MKENLDPYLETEKLAQMGQKASLYLIKLSAIRTFVVGLIQCLAVIYFFFFHEGLKALVPSYGKGLALLFSLLALGVGTYALIRGKALHLSDLEAEGQSRGDRLATFSQRQARIKASFQVYFALVLGFMILIFALFTLFTGWPWPVGLVLVFFGLSIPLIQTAISRRVESVDFEETAGHPWEEITPYEGEVIRAGVAGLWRAGGNPFDEGFEVMGKGERPQTDNALLITDRALYGLTIPLKGAGYLLGGVNISFWQWQLAYEDIQRGLEAMVADLSLEDLFREGRANRLMDRGKIREVTRHRGQISLQLLSQEGEKVSLLFRKEEDLDRVKKFFDYEGH